MKYFSTKSTYSSHREVCKATPEINTLLLIHTLQAKDIHESDGDITNHSLKAIKVQVRGRGREGNNSSYDFILEPNLVCIQASGTTPLTHPQCINHATIQTLTVVIITYIYHLYTGRKGSAKETRETSAAAAI